MIKLSFVRFFVVFEVILIFFICFFHLILIDQIPRGIHIDEASIALNAVTISESGKDEFGTSWPLYFKAFGEYKNPVYIYAAGGLFKLLGVSLFTLKLTSFLFYFVALIAIYYLVKILFPNQKIIQIYGLLSIGFLPQYFTLSRVSFEVISQLPVVALTLIGVYYTFKTEVYATKKEVNLGYILAVLTGFLFGISVYTYSTARLLSFLSIFALIWVYKKKEFWTRILVVSGSMFVALIPWIIFFIKHPDTLTNRFDSGISYVTLPFLAGTWKGVIFAFEYLSYFSPKFLFSQGDPILRHSIGFGGAVFATTALLFFLGIIYIFWNKKWKGDYFLQFILFNLFISPAAAALTWESAPHSLRSFLIGMYIVIISAYGLKFIIISKKNDTFSSVKLNFWQQPNSLSKAFLLLLFPIFLWEIAGYQVYYFANYPEKSVEAFAGYDFPKALQKAIDQKPKQIVVSNAAYYPYTYLEFSKRIVKNPDNIKMSIGDLKPYPNSCLLYFRDNESDLKKYTDQYRDLSEKEDWVKVRCY